MARCTVASAVFHELEALLDRPVASPTLRAFALAERILGASWQLKGRGHCRRASLNALYSSHALKGAARSWSRVRPHQALTWKRLMPVAIIEKAAEPLGVPAALLMSREY